MIICIYAYNCISLEPYLIFKYHDYYYLTAGPESTSFCLFYIYIYIYDFNQYIFL